MTRKTASWLVVIPIVAFGCGSGDSGGNHGASGGDGGLNDGSSADDATPAPGDDGSTPEGDGSLPTGDNVAPLIVDNGPAGGGGSFDVPFISVTLCVPGTTTCQTIDHVTVDTGSSGLRILSSVLSSTLTLPVQTATGSSPLAECFTFEDGFVWGSVNLADVKIGGEIAGKVPVQIMNSKYASVPADCSSTGQEEDNLAAFGSNGLIGINQIVPDEGMYYSCTGSSCADLNLADSGMVSNPIPAFAKDNNGAVVQFPTVAATGALTLAGALIFGIGTESNNALGSAKVLTVDEYGNFTTIFNGATLNTSYIDSGTTELDFNDSAIPPCTSQLSSGFFCPKSPVSLSAENKGLNGVTSTVSFSVADADTLFSGSNTAFDDIAAPYGDSDDSTFAWGFPFFVGRSVYLGLDGATTPGGKGPYVAY